MTLSPEITKPRDSFVDELGPLLVAIGELHPDPDNDMAMHFERYDAGGNLSVEYCSPRQYPQEVINGTERGEAIVAWYRQLATNMGDPTGQTLFDGLRAQLRRKGVEVSGEVPPAIDRRPRRLREAFLSVARDLLKARIFRSKVT